MSLYYPDLASLIYEHPWIYDISENTDYSHEEYCKKIIGISEFLGYAYGKKATYKIDAGNDTILVRLFKDDFDGRFYDYCEYRIIKAHSYVNPCIFTMLTPEKFWRLYEDTYSKKLEYEVVSFRKYGQPKLKKPKELKGIKSSGSATYIPNRCNPRFYVKDDDVWIKHTDYFSPSYEKPEDIGMPLSYRMEKYEVNKKCSGDKFIYADCWSDIVLRQEAWLKISNLIPFLREHNNIQASMEIVRLMKECHCLENGSIDSKWNRFYEDLCTKVRATSGEE